MGIEGWDAAGRWGAPALFVFAWFFAVTADWLQGPYIYVVLEEHGFGHAEIAYIFAVGFATSLFAGIFAAHLAGQGNVRKFLKNGFVFEDGNGTKMTSYMKQFGGYILNL